MRYEYCHDSRNDFGKDDASALQPENLHACRVVWIHAHNQVHADVFDHG